MFTSFGGVVIDTENRILLRQTGDSGEAWALPFGPANPGETYGQAAIRSVREETGVHAEINGVIDIDATDNTLFETQFFRMAPLGDYAGDELDSVCWATIDEAEQMVGRNVCVPFRTRDLAVLVQVRAMFKAAAALAELLQGKPLASHPLATKDGRIAFLWALWEEHQEPGLLAATHHVWASLAAPAGARCTLMAQRLGLPGKGKVALAGVLAHYLATVNKVDIPDLPDRDAYVDPDAWNADCLAHFDHVRKLLLAVMLRYEAILDGRDPDAVAPPEGTVITGPWGSKGA